MKFFTLKALAKLAVTGVFALAWGWLIQLLAGVCLRLRPELAGGDLAAIFICGLLGPMAVYLAQGLLYIGYASEGQCTAAARRRPKPRSLEGASSPSRFKQGQTIFAESLPTGSSRVKFLLLPFRFEISQGEAFVVVVAPDERPALLAELDRPAGLLARLSLLLDERGPLDCALNFIINLHWPLISQLTSLFYRLMAPARLFLRLWGYVSFLLWRAWDDPGPLGSRLVFKRSVAYDLHWRLRLHRGGEGDALNEAAGNGCDLAPACSDIDNEGLELIWAELPRVFDNPAYGGREPLDEGQTAAEGAAAIYGRRPATAARYRGAYLDYPATVLVRQPDDMYDGGPEESPDLFHTPELGLELELLARLKAETRRLKAVLAARGGRPRGLIRLDGRLIPAFRLEAELADLEYEAGRLLTRLAAHNRRCRSSCLAAAKRRGPQWAEALAGLGLKLFQAEKNGTHDAGEALDALLKAEDAVYDPEAEAPEVEAGESEAQKGDAPKRIDGASMLQGSDASPQFGGGLGIAAGNGSDRPFALDNSAKRTLPGEEPFKRTDWESEPDYFGLGLGRCLLSVLLMVLLLWKAQSLGLVELTVYNGLGCMADVSISGRHYSVEPYEAAAPVALEPGRLYHIKTICLSPQKGSAPQEASSAFVVEDFSARLNNDRRVKHVYNIASAAPLMEWGGPDGRTEFLGRQRWLATKAVHLFRLPPDRVSLALAGYGRAAPRDMLESFDDDKNKEDLIRLHARWDEPGSPWFWQWQILMTGLDDQHLIILDRLAADPTFLDRAGDSLTDYNR